MSNATMNILSRITGQDQSFYQSVVTRVLEYKDKDKANASLIRWAGRREMEEIYTKSHVQVIVEVEDSFKFGEYDEDMNPVPSTMATIKFYDPIYGRFYKEWITILDLTPADYAVLNIQPAPGTFK